jgi:ribosomal-protein-alanine N-acetyltransferase
MDARDIFLEHPELETARLVLRRLTPDDAADIFAYASDPDVAALTTWEAHRTLDDTHAFLERVAGWYADGFGGPWGVILKESGRVIGTCGMAIVPEHRRAELGYALARACWGQGLMTEAVVAVIDYGFATLSLNRIEARCLPENLASARVLEKAGLTYEGTLREQYLTKDRFIDLRMYAILRREWKSTSNTGA